MASPPRPGRAARRSTLLVLLALLAALAPVTRGPWKGGEQLVANASSRNLSRRLAAWSTDEARASAEPVAWYSSLAPIERGYVRVLPSALFSLQVATFGPNAPAVRLVTLAIHLAACWLGLRLLRRFLGDQQKAAAVVLLMGLHGASFEVVTWESCQAIVVAALLALVAATLHVELRCGGRRATLAAIGVVGVCLLAMTSYEAAVVLPLALLLLDRALDARTLRPLLRESAVEPVASPRWLVPALLSLLPLYALVAWIAARALGLGPFPGKPFFALYALVLELAAYVARTLLYFPVGDRLGAGIWLLVLAAFPAMHLLLRRATRRSTVALGVAVYLLFLAPPLLARATVSVLNRPTMRQLYLPLLGAAILLAVVPGPMTRRRWVVVGAMVATAAALNAAVWVIRTPPPGYERLRASVRRELDRAGSERTVLVVGRARCEGPHGAHEYRVEYDAGAREVVQLLPLARDGELPEIEVTGERTLLARAASGFSWDELRRPPSRLERVPPVFAKTDVQRTALGQFEVRARQGETVSELAITLDRPLRDHVVLLLHGCEEARRLAAPGSALLVPAR